MDAVRKIWYLLGAILFCCFSSIAVFAGGDELEFVQETVLSEVENTDQVLFDGFQEMDYYMLLQSHVGCGVSLDYYSYGIYGNITKTVQEGEELYFKINNEQLGNTPEPENQTEYTDWMKYNLSEHIVKYSPDMELCITNQGFYEYSTCDYMEKLYKGKTLLSENEEKLYYDTRVEKYTFCKEPETGCFVIMDEEKRKRIDNLINTVWEWEKRDHKIYYGKSRFCLSEDGDLMALVKPDNQHIGIYETKGCTELFEIRLEQMDKDWPLEVFEIQGSTQAGWLTFSNGDKAFQFFYPSNEIVPLGEFMFNISMSPDGKYCTYYTGSDLLYSSWEYLYEDNWVKFEEMLKRWKKIPSGWYIKELDSGLVTYIPVISAADNGQPPLDGKCMWVQKDKLIKLFEVENNIEKSEQENVEEQLEQEEILEEPLIKRVVGEDTSEIGGHETENTNYALYPSTIVESNPKDKPSRFAIWEKTMDITFPQIYYSNEYGDYHGSEIETAINHELFMCSMGNSDSFLVGRDGRLLREYTSDYEITKADDELISIKYYRKCLNVYRDNDLCEGITLDIITGEKVALSEFTTLENNLVEQVENGKIQYISSWFEWEDVIDSVERFSELYQKGIEDVYSCYYLEKDAINLIIDLMDGNSSYFILRIPLE